MHNTPPSRPRRPRPAPPGYAALRAENARLRRAIIRLQAGRAEHEAAAQRRVVRAEALREIGRQLSAELDFDRFLAGAAQSLMTLMDVRDCVLGVWHPETRDLTPDLYVCDGERRAWSVRIRPGEGRGLTSALIAERRTIHVPDYLEECARRGLAPVALDGDWRGLAWIGVPLLAGGQFVGALVVERRGRAFDPEEVATLEAFAGQLAGAMENARLYAAMRQLATRDPLTGLANHRHLHERLDQEVARAARHGHPLAVAMLDLNDFKRHNDTHGHQAGDALLRAIAAALRAESRAEDVAGRYGGDEFMLILPETTGEEAHALLARVRRRLAAGPGPLGGGDGTPVTTSYGVAACPADATDAHALIALADAALYADKRAHRARAGQQDAVLA